MLRRAVSTVIPRTIFWSNVHGPSAMISTYSVEHDASNHRFVIDLQNGEHILLIDSRNRNICTELCFTHRHIRRVRGTTVAARTN